MKARWEVMKITVGSEETRLLGKACKCFSRNPGQVKNMNGVASSDQLLCGISLLSLSY